MYNLIFKEKQGLFKRILSVILSLTLLMQLTTPVFAKENSKDKGHSDYIIKYSEGSDYDSVKGEFKDKKIKEFKDHKKLKNKKYGVVTIDDSVATRDYLASVAETDAVEYIVPDSQVSLFENSEIMISVDSSELIASYFEFVDGLEYNTDSEIIIAVADTGIDFDVITNIYNNSLERNNLKDDDNNSFTNDIHGWNFIEDNGETNIDATHGTVVANIINLCIPDATILPLVVADSSTLSANVSDIIDAIHYADEIGAKIMNCSWGAATYNYALKDAMATSEMLFVCSTDNNTDNITYPAEFGLENVISVGSLDYDNKADVRFASTISATGPNNVEGIYSGNSYATAFITSAMAYLYNASDNSYSAPVIANALRQTIYYSDDETRVFFFDEAYDPMLSYAHENQYIEYLNDITNSQNRAISNEIKAILINDFENLSDEEFSVISEAFHINPSMRSKLSSLGCSLPKAVAVCVLANQLDIATETALDHFMEAENYNIYKQNITALVEIQDLLGYSNESARSYLQSLGDRTVIDIIGAIIASNICNIDFDTIVTTSKNTLTSIDFSSPKITEQNRDTYVKLLLEYNLNQNGLDSVIDGACTAESILTSIQSWQQNNNFYITNTNVYLQSSSADEIQSVQNKYQMPSSHNIMDDVSVSDMYGMMTYSKNLISLSGKNGLDLDLSLRYDEDDAISNNEYGDLDAYGSEYCAVYTVDVYWVDDIASGPVFTDFTERSEAYTDPSLHLQYLQRTYWEDGSFAYYVTDPNETQIVAKDSGYSHIDGTRTASFYQERYSLGAGWTFNFPAIEDNRSGSTGKMVLHFSDGQKYTINPTTLALEGYSYKDITFSEVSSSVFTSSDRSSKWMITYKDGRRDFLDSTGRYIGSAGKDIGSDTERIEVHYNSDGYVSEIIDTVGRKITLTYNHIETVDEDLGETFYHREIDIKFFDKDSTSGSLLYKITQFVDWTMGCYTICWLSTYDDNGDALKSIRYAYDLYDTSLWYNFRGSYIPDNEESYEIYDSYSSVLGSIYYSTREYEDVNASTIIEYEAAYRTISDASIAEYPRVKSVYTIEYGDVTDETAADVIKNKQEYTYEVTGSTGTVTDFVMNAWNDINSFNENIESEGYRSVLYPKSTGYSYSVTMKQTVDSSGNYQKATTNYYNDDRQMEKVCVYSLDASGNKTLVSQTENAVLSATTQRRTTRKYGTGGAEHVAVYEVTYDDYANIIESHSYTGTAINSGTIQNIKKQEDVYRTFGTNKYIPTKEETIVCDATGMDQAYRVIVENTIASSGNDILKQRIYAEDEYDGEYLLTYKDIEYTYDSNYFNVLKEQMITEGYYVDYKTTEYVYDSKYGIFRSEIIYSSEIPNWEEYGIPEPEDVAHHYYEYDKFGRTVKYINGDESHTTTYTYDNLNSLIATVHPDSSTSTSTIDYVNNTVIETEADGSKIKYVYDFFGQMSEEYIFDGSQYRLSMRYEYDNNNRLIATYQYLNEEGTDYVKATVEYDALDRVVSKKTYNKDGVLLSREDYAYSLELYNQVPCEKVLTTTYNGDEASRIIEYFDSSGNLVCEKIEYALNQYYTNTYTYGNYSVLISAQGDTIDTVSYVYDTQGRLMTATFADNSYCQYGYDGFSRLTYYYNQNDERSFYFYGATDNLMGTQTAFDVQVVDYDGVEYPENLYAYKLYRYDFYGNLIYEGTQNNNVGETETYSEKYYTYDGSDRLVKVEEKIDENNSIYAQFYYDAAGRVLREYTGLTDPLTINGLDQVVVGTDSEFSVTKYTYDYRGNIASCTHSDGTVDTYTYSFNNLLLSKQVNGTTVVQYTYDKLGRTLSEYVDANNYHNYTYDALGNLISASNATETITYTYDYLGSPLTETRTSTADNADYVKTFTYAPRGLATYKLDLINDSTNIAETKYYQQYTYDDFGRLASVVQSDSVSSAVNYTISYTYDPVGRVTSQTTVTPSLSTTKTMTYNALGLVKSSTQTSTDNSINISETYTYRYDGNLIEKTADGVTTKYTYDNVNRLLKEENYNSSNTLTDKIEYGYDDRWNCTSKISTNYTSGTVAKTDTLVYNSSNQLTSKTSFDSATNLTDTYTYTYDSKGNCTGYTKNTGSASSETVIYQYDVFNQFVGQKTNGVQDFTYSYDVFGQRVTKTVGSGSSAITTNHYWLGNTIILDENAATNGTTSYVFGNGIAGLVSSGQEYVYGTNARGDVTSILGTTSVNEYTYDAYGNVTDSSETTLTVSNPYRYGSYYFDEESGLYYLNARYYDAENSRFTQRDTYIGEISSPSTLNLYVYTAGNPIYYTDPSGHWFETFLDVVSFGFSLYEAIKEPSVGNIVAAVVDAAAIVVPFIPGTGIAKAGMKVADAADDVYDYYKAADRTYETIDNFVDTGRAIENSTDAMKIGNKVDDSVDILRNVENSADTLQNVATTTNKVSIKVDNSTEILQQTKRANNAKAKSALLESAPTLDTSAAKKAFEGTGNITSKPYANSRPSFRKGVVEEVWNNAKGSDGLVRDPNTLEVIDWTPGQSRRNVWDMGHVPEAKYSEMHKKYMAGEMTPKEFVDWYNDPRNYRPELPSNNRSHRYE